MTIQTYLQYKDPQIFHWRKGTPDDPYVPRKDSLPVINGVITLNEIPSEVHRVKIFGLSEITIEVYNRVRELKPDQFLVNYTNGVIQLHPSHEGKVFLVEYYGKGLILQPASRVYAMVHRSPDVVKTLQDIIDEMLQKIEKDKQAAKHLQNVINEALSAINSANIATDNANRARDDAIQATLDAREATQEALDAAASTIMIYKEPVSTLADLEIAYPNPENGWRVMIEETGDIYRYDGIVTHRWQLIDNYTGGSIPFASETTSGLLHVEDYKNFIVKRVVFLMPSIFKTGVQNYMIQFPHDGEIIDAKAYCTVTGNLSPIELSVERISSDGFEKGDSWENIFSNNIIINAGQYIGTEPTILNKKVDAGDYFRVNVLQLDNHFKGVSVQLDIKIHK